MLLLQDCAKRAYQPLPMVRLVGDVERGCETYSKPSVMTLSGNVEPYSMMFKMDSETDNHGRIGFNVGQNPQPVWVGNVRLEVESHSMSGAMAPLVARVVAVTAEAIRPPGLLAAPINCPAFSPAAAARRDAGR